MGAATRRLEAGGLLLEPHGMLAGGLVASWHHQQSGEGWDFLYVPDRPEGTAGGLALVKDSTQATVLLAAVGSPAEAAEAFAPYMANW